MRGIRVWWRSAAAIGMMVAGMVAAGGAQEIPGPATSGSKVPGGIDPLSGTRNSGVPAAMQEKMAIQRNDERQRRLVADTEQLLSLATELKAEVDKTDKHTLSLDVVKRTTEIEKLAKSIRERMKE